MSKHLHFFNGDVAGDTSIGESIHDIQDVTRDIIDGKIFEFPPEFPNCYVQTWGLHTVYFALSIVASHDEACRAMEAITPKTWNANHTGYNDIGYQCRMYAGGYLEDKIIVCFGGTTHVTKLELYYQGAGPHFTYRRGNNAALGFWVIGIGC